MVEALMANQGGENVSRDYRKGNWTVEETMVLIEAKKMDEERRMKSERGKPLEQRWKWVEDYCWRKGCFRSQSQCNDKWDNLMRDFKKVREYERRRLMVGKKSHEMDDEISYWRIDKSERKEKNLPSNMLSQIYEALVEVVEKRGQKLIGGGVDQSPVFVGQPSLLPPIVQHSTQNPTGGVCVLPPTPRPPPHPQILSQPTTSTVPSSQPLPIVDSEASEHSDSPAKRRRKGGEGTSGEASDESHEVGTAITKSATIIAKAIQACTDREERRHQELLSLHEKRLQIEESKAEISRQSINGLVDAVNNLANSILALVANKNQVNPK